MTDPSNLPRLPERLDRTVDVIDSHTCGQPTRVVIAGAGIAPGTDPRAARDILTNDRDWIRRLVVLEPRGHRSMFGVILIPPTEPGAHFGLVYMDASGYPDMCGHATIGAVTTLFEMGYLKPKPIDLSGEMVIALVVPMGTLSLRVRFEQGRCVAVAFRTPLAFFLGSLELDLPGGGCPVDIAYGGQWYAFAPVEHSGLAIAPTHMNGLIAGAAIVREKLAKTLTLIDPLTGTVPVVGNIVWISAPDGEAADARNVPVSSAGSFDRSPCGTATCARMAVLEATGRLSLGQPFVNQGLVGTVYRGRLVAHASHAGVSGVVPEVEGSAWLTGIARLARDPHDPLRDGFMT